MYVCVAEKGIFMEAVSELAWKGVEGRGGEIEVVEERWTVGPGLGTRN